MADQSNSERDRRLAYEKQLPQPDHIQVVDFFSNCGGVSYGFKSVRQSRWAFKIIAGIDIDGTSLETYEHMIGAPGVQKDIFELSDDIESLRQLLVNHGLDFSKPFLFIGCAPCQGFSAHRKKDKVDDARNALPARFAKICAALRPHYVVMENVPEVFTGRFKEYMDEALKVLQNSGYHITKGIVDFSQYGVPQRRKRAIVLGALDGGPVQMPAPLFPPEAVLTVRDAIGHLDAIESGEGSPYDPWHRAPAHTERILEMIRKIPPDGGDRRSLSEEEQLACHRRMAEREATGFTDVYGRLFWDKPSVSITAKSSTPSCGRFLHPEQHRNISVREAALLQGFPPSFEFKGPLVHQYRQIGEAVPPLLSRFIAWEILNHKCPIDPPEFLTYPTPREQTVAVGEQPPTAVEAFCGAGGLSLGMMEAGVAVKLAFDINEDALETYVNNLGDHGTRLDVTETSAEDILKLAGLKQAPDIFAGGPPCQGFSQQRRGPNEDSRNNLVTSFAMLAVDLSPKAILLENVTYLDSPRGREILRYVLHLWEQNGYVVFRHDLNSADFGVPQLRPRILIVAIKREYAHAYQGPVPTHSERWLTVGEALLNLPEPTESPLVGQLIHNHEPSREGDMNRRRIAFVGMGEGRLAIPPHLQLPCHKDYDGHLDVFGRLDWFGHARTITGGFDSFTRGEYGHPFRHRSITHREAARLQGFPDWFVFNGNKAAVRKQIGNAVPPPMGKAVAEAIVAAIRSVQEAHRRHTQVADASVEVAAAGDR